MIDAIVAEYLAVGISCDGRSMIDITLNMMSENYSADLYAY